MEAKVSPRRCSLRRRQEPPPGRRPGRPLARVRPPCQAGCPAPRLHHLQSWLTMGTPTTKAAIYTSLAVHPNRSQPHCEHSARSGPATRAVPRPHVRLLTAALSLLAASPCGLMCWKRSARMHAALPTRTGSASEWVRGRAGSRRCNCSTCKCCLCVGPHRCHHRAPCPPTCPPAARSLCSTGCLLDNSTASPRPTRRKSSWRCTPSGQHTAL